MTSGHSEMTIYKKSDADDSKSVTTDFGQTRMTIFKKSFATDRHFSLCTNAFLHYTHAKKQKVQAIQTHF